MLELLAGSSNSQLQRDLETASNIEKIRAGLDSNLMVMQKLNPTHTIAKHLKQMARDKRVKSHRCVLFHRCTGNEMAKYSFAICG